MKVADLQALIAKMEEEESQLARNLAKVKSANTKLTQKITQLTKTNPKDQ